MVAFALKDGRKDAKGNDIKYDEFDIMARLKEYHWQLPAYCLPKHAECACLLPRAAAVGQRCLTRSCWVPAYPDHPEL